MKLELIPSLVGADGYEKRQQFAERLAGDLTPVERRLYLHIAEGDTGDGYRVTVERLCFLVGMDLHDGHLALQHLVELGLVAKDLGDKGVIHLVTVEDSPVVYVNFDKGGVYEGVLEQSDGDGKVKITLEPQGANPFRGSPLSYERVTLKGLEVQLINIIYSFTQEKVDDGAGAGFWVCTMTVFTYD